MSDEEPAENPLRLAIEDAEAGFSNLEFAIKLLSHCELNKLDPTSFDSEHVTRLDEGDITFPMGSFSTTEQLIRAASINVLIAFSVSILVLDQAFDVASVGRNPESADDIERLRVLIYMMRNAVAHGIAAPKWIITKQKYLVQLSVPVAGQTINVDLTALNGKEFSVADIGGYVAWFNLRTSAMTALNAKAQSGS